MSDIIEKLAALAHQQWSGWMTYFLGKTIEVGDGNHEVHYLYVKALEKLISTPYAELDEEQKDNDRAEAKRVIEALGLRPEVLLFAMAMERKLRENDYKGGWKDESFAVLWERLREETFELDDAVENDNDILILSEAADVANFAMMIADVKGALK